MFIKNEYDQLTQHFFLFIHKGPSLFNLIYWSEYKHRFSSLSINPSNSVYIISL